LATIDEFDPTFLTDLVGHIYEAAVDPDHWDEFLTILERVYPGSRVTLFGHENGRPSETLTRYRQHRRRMAHLFPRVLRPGARAMVEVTASRSSDVASAKRRPRRSANRPSSGAPIAPPANTDASSSDS
jgi:hypothetical protein